MNTAIIRTGGKQYIVGQGQTVTIEKIPGDVGSTVRFADVLLVMGDGSVSIGTPTVASATVHGVIKEQGRGDKITVVKYKPKVRYRRKRGHRQALTRVEITNISSNG